MEIRNTKLALTASALAMALMLAGCGGGGSSGTANTASGGGAPPPTTPTDDTPPAPTPMAVELPSDSDMYLGDDLMAPMDTTTPIMLATGGTHEDGSYTLTCTAGPCEITITDGEVMATGTVDPTYSTAAQGIITDAKMAASDEGKGRAMGLYEALTDDPPRDEMILGASKKLLMVSHDGSSVMVSVGGRTGWEVSDDAPMSIDGWAGTMLKGTAGSLKTQSYTVYTNIEAPKRKEFSKVYKAGATNLPAGITHRSAVLNGLDEHIELNNAAMKNAGEYGWLDPTGFPPATASAKFEYTGADGKKRLKFAGTFQGASGTYECYGGDCVVTVTAATTAQAATYDFATGSAGAWRFFPAKGNAAQIVEQDADYMHFGWWVDTPSKAKSGGEFLYDAQVFADGRVDYVTTANINALTGEVEYEGPAAGLYAVKAHKDKDEMDVAAAHGEFMATAKLTANFGDATDPGSVKGTIDAFQSSGNVDMSAWKLTLNMDTIGSTGGNSTTAGGNIVDGSDVIGNWNYQLHGPERDSKGVALQPSGIAGAFRADIDKNTAVAGAFGATKQ